MRGIVNRIDVPDALARQVILFAIQNDERFPKRRRDRDPFVKLTDAEIAALEEIVTTAFSNEIQLALRKTPHPKTRGHPK